MADKMLPRKNEPQKFSAPVKLVVTSRSEITHERLKGLFNGTEKYRIKYTPPKPGSSTINGNGELEVVAIL